MDRPTLFVALFAPMMLFLSGALAAQQDAYDALLFGALGLASYACILRDLVKALKRAHGTPVVDAIPSPSVGQREQERGGE